MSLSIMATPVATQAATPQTHGGAPRAQAGRIVAFVTDPVTDGALRTGLSAVTEDLQMRRGTVLNAAKYLEREPAPQAIIVDISGLEDPLTALEALARVCPPDVTVAVIGENVDIGFYRLLLNEVGVAEYLPKPITRDAVERLLVRHFAPGHAVAPMTRGGHVVAVCGASGGAGATTMAVSIALELAGEVKANVALLDLNLQHGAAALMLGARPGPGLRIALEEPDKADTLLLERTAIRIDQRMHLVAADESLGSGISISETGARRVLGLVRQKFNYVVVDLPMPLRPELHQMLTLARHIVIVLQPDVASVRNAREIRQLAMTMAGTDRVITVLNRADMRGGLPTARAAQARGSALHVVVPELGTRMPESVNLGGPAIKRVPDLRKHLSPLIQEIGAVSLAKPSMSWLRGLLRK